MTLSAPSTSGRVRAQTFAGSSRGRAHIVDARPAPACRSRRRRQHLTVSRAVAERAAAPPASLSALGESLRHEFPILDQEINGKPLAYLDNAATSQKPLQVLQAMDSYYRLKNSNVHRGIHYLSTLATTAYEEARQKVAAFINAPSDREIVFTRNATEAINLVAQTWGVDNLKAGDEIVLSVAEHHANLVPWQMLAQRTGAVLRHAELTLQQEVDTEAVKALIGPKTKLVSLVHVSNVLGGILPTDEIVTAAHQVGARVMLDCCQSVPNMPVDVKQLGVDWVVASSHKMCGPTGIGFLWGSSEVLATMGPWMGGGEMIQDVFLDHATYAEPPARFEAGTPAIAEAVGLGAACDYLSAIGMGRIHEAETALGTYLYEQLAAVPGVTIYGPPPSRGRAALASFNVAGLHATDVSTLLDTSGIAVRSGHHCTQPLHRHLGISASARASLYLYSTATDVDRFIAGLKESIAFFS